MEWTFYLNIFFMIVCWHLADEHIDEDGEKQPMWWFQMFASALNGVFVAFALMAV